jgi:hypothetical protein
MNVLDDPTSDAPALLVHHRLRRAGPTLRDVVPATVTGPAQLPPYLMLGARDDSSFRADADGWSAVWRGLDPDTELHWRFRRSANTNTISHRWRGIDGGSSTASASIRVEQTIGSLYAPLPRQWDAAAQSLFGANWRLEYFSVPSAKHAVVYSPDGPLRNVIVPICVERAAGFARQWVSRVHSANLPFPMATWLTRMRCDTAYVYGCHGVDDEDPSPLLARCKRQTGLGARRPAERVRAADERPAWDIERHLLCVLTTVPFAGLASILQMLEDTGVLTSAREPFALRDDRPDGAAPLVVPVEFAAGTQLTLWSPDRTVRVRWVLSEPSPPDAQGASGAGAPH